MSDHSIFLYPYHEDFRFAPNILLRSALFGALPPGQARKVCDAAVPSQIPALRNLYLAMCHGPVFDQGDLDVFLAIMHEVAIREVDSGVQVSQVSLPVRGLLAATGRQDGGKNRSRLCQSLMRLGQSQLIAGSTGEMSVSTDWGSLIKVSANSRSADISLSDDVRELYKAGFTGINWVEREQLSPLGKWLHAFYSSHGRAPLRIKVQTIRQLCGRSLEVMGMASTFGKSLENELSHLAAVTKWKCSIEDGKVVVRKPGNGLGGNANSAAEYRERLEGDDWSEEI